MTTRTSWNELLRVAAFCAPLACAACTTTGTARGELKQPGGEAEPVTLVWKSHASGPEKGQIATTLPDGTHYSGHYTEVVTMEPAAAGALAVDTRGPRWTGWRAPWFRGDITDVDRFTYVEVHPGKVNANLKSDDGSERMSCQFTIEKPEQGLTAGGTGQCQLSDGQTFEDVIVSRR